MKIFNNIREFFWPLLEKSQIPEPKQISPEEITVSSTHIEKTLEYAINCYEAENERKKTVEGKSSLFIGTISVITSVIIGATSVLVKINDYNITISFIVLLLFVLTVYMTRTVWFSIKALERKSYHTLSINDFLISDSDETYYRKIISEITNKVRKNSIVINGKVDNMTMAQEYFKRAIVIVALYSFVILLLFLSKSGIDFSRHFQKCIALLNRIELNGWNTIILYVLAITSFLLSIKALMRKNK
ncbi:MAG: hypothetical protein HXX16_01435 [Bacteroidales bacterium]|nr:hypothetical protein [Bacteroidales bacterium]